MWPPNYPSSSLSSRDHSAKLAMNDGSLILKIPTVGKMRICHRSRDGLADQITTLDHFRTQGLKDDLTDQIATPGQVMMVHDPRDGLIDQITILDRFRMLHGLKGGLTDQTAIPDQAMMLHDLNDGLIDQTATPGQVMMLHDPRGGLIDQIGTLTHAKTEAGLIDGMIRTVTLLKDQLLSAGARRR